jgi:nucleoside-diphosphate-sugar epimerase
MANPSNMQRPRALITGINGFTGVYLAERLERAGYEVFGTVFGDVKANDRQFHVDLCDQQALREIVQQIQPEIVAHLAAISFVAHDSADDIYRINVVGTRNLLSALTQLESAPKCVLVASSANIYGNATQGVIAEDAPAQPANDYAVSKLAMEHVARLWMDKLPIVVTRPFNYTGVGQAEQFLLPKIVSHFKRGAKQIELGNLDVERDFSDVRSIAAAYHALLERAPRGETFNICSGQAYSLQEIISLIEKIAGYTIEVRVNPAFVRANEVKRLLGNPDKLQRCIGPIEQHSLYETLTWMLQAPTPN